MSGGVSRAGLVEAAAGPRCGEDQTRLGEPSQQSAQYTLARDNLVIWPELPTYHVLYSLII